MTLIFSLFLFVLQLIGFYFLVILYMKVAKFDELKEEQQKLMDEMEDTLGAYLVELKDENDRLVDRLAQFEKSREVQPKKLIDVQDETDEEKFLIKPTKVVPVKTALKSYGATTNMSTAPKKDSREYAFALCDEGFSIEEIAKKLGKGKTEVELLLKFR